MVNTKIHKRQEAVIRSEYRTIIVGSRGLRGSIAYALVALAVKRSRFKITEVISGTALDVDTAGVQWAADNKLPVRPIPDLVNNTLTLAADALIAIWDGKSAGTKCMVRMTIRCGMPIYVLEVRAFGVSMTIGGTLHQFVVVVDPAGVLLWVPDSLSGWLARNIEDLMEQCNAIVEAI